MGSPKAGGGLVVTNLLQESTPHRSNPRTKGKREVLVQILFSLSLSLSFAMSGRFWPVMTVSATYPDFFLKRKEKKTLIVYGF